MVSKEKVVPFIEAKKDLLIQISDAIWEYAETRFEEVETAELLCKVLTDEGFAVTKDIADMKTAFTASYGNGQPVIGFLGEFDALHGLSQVAGINEKKPLVEGGKGHGCGHHALGVGALAAAVAVKEYLKRNNITGTVRYYGCPGEEGGSGKAYLARAGYFKDVDAALTWHPGNTNSVVAYNCQATICAYFKFSGISAHAAASPHLGRSALDALELMNIGVNFLREHVMPDVRIHYAITDAGGRSPNVVQSRATALYQVRAPRLQQTGEIYERVINIAKGAALMTDTQMEVIFDRASSDIIPNHVLNQLIDQKLREMGPVPVDQTDVEYAGKIRASLSEEEKTSDTNMVNTLYGENGKDIIRKITHKEIIDIVYPYLPVDITLPGSTDVGDASRNMPLAQFNVACFAKDTPAHSWQIVTQGKSNLCHKAMIHAAKILALAGAELFENPELVARAKQEFEERLGGKAYICPIPPEVKPSPLR